MTQIYCTHCGKRLQADKTISFCTSCGKKLPEVIEEEKTYTDMGALLRGVRDEYGIEVFKDAFKVKGILRDKAPELQGDSAVFGCVGFLRVQGLLFTARRQLRHD